MVTVDTAACQIAPIAAAVHRKNTAFISIYDFISDSAACIASIIVACKLQVFETASELHARAMMSIKFFFIFLLSCPPVPHNSRCLQRCNS
jgi:hypothetical protein